MTARPEYYEQSYPPSLWGGGSTPPVANPPTGVTTGKPGSFTPSGADVPADLVALQALGALGQTAAWATGDYVTLGDSSKAHWDGGAWVADAADEPDIPDESWTKAEIIAWLFEYTDTDADGSLSKSELLAIVAELTE